MKILCMLTEKKGDLTAGSVNRLVTCSLETVLASDVPSSLGSYVSHVRTELNNTVIPFLSLRILSKTSLTVRLIIGNKARTPSNVKHIPHQEIYISSLLFVIVYTHLFCFADFMIFFTLFTPYPCNACDSNTNEKIRV